MKNKGLSVALICVLGLSVETAARPQTAPPRQALVDQYCLACHNAKTKSGGMVLEGFRADDPAAHPEIWERVIRKIEANEMPPPGMPRPDNDTAVQFTRGLISQIDAAAERAPYAGKPVIRRLNRAEYSNAVRDLFGVDFRIGEDLPSDGVAAGFDNVGEALSMSPLLLERYMKTARRIGQMVVGISDPSPLSKQYLATRPQSAWQGGDMPFGTRGGMSVSHYFPRTGDYNLRAFLYSQNDQLSAIEGVRFFQAKTRVSAGLHSFAVTFPDDFSEREGPTPNTPGPGGRPIGGPVDMLGSAIRPTIEILLDGHRVASFDVGGPNSGEATMYQGGPPTLEKMEVAGPYNVAKVETPPARNRIFLCKPARPADESACASKILSEVARRAFRRDVTPADRDWLMAGYTRSRASHTFDEAIGDALALMLVSPDFLFRIEKDHPGASADAIQPVSDFELASRLSFFLWSSIPDDELLTAARSGKLHEPAVLHQQVNRMLADPRSDTLIDNFATQWLGIRALVDAKPNPALFPDFDPELREAYQEETRLLIRRVMKENRSLFDLVDPDFTFVNERLAKAYGIPNILGPGFRRIPLSTEQRAQRGGLLGQGTILLLTSHPDKTSPVLRGKWVLDNLLNSPPPPPPPGVPPLDLSPANGKQLTTRQQVERHRASAVCSSCHSRMDPFGFALENFDAAGQWRTMDGGSPIDANGKLRSGDELTGLPGLKEFFVRHSDDFADATVGRLMTFALGRQLDPRDQPAIRKILSGAASQRYRFFDLIMGVVDSVPFQMRQSQEPL